MSSRHTAAPAKPKTNALAVVSLVVSILSFFTFVFILSIVGIVTGTIAKRQIAASTDGGAGLAKAGVIIGWISLVWGIVGVIALAVFLNN
ncbi:DUF4190 domain-containing protein [Rhodococcus sovatensis]|uniref:DUF4190 domain-containing protein n=1 Tax=Rhodococcus sovatensis TaxID=1805840 RepID=A0ABZ2PS16_9NOCA